MPSKRGEICSAEAHNILFYSRETQARTSLSHQSHAEPFFISCLEKAPAKREVSFSQLPSSSGNPLEVIGTGGRVTETPAHHEMLEDEILDEVLVLLARLDRERLRLIHSCEREQLIRGRLKESIDHWRLKRLHDLPLAVQKGQTCPPRNILA